MNTAIVPLDFYKTSIQVNDYNYKVILTKELNPITITPTGNYIGTLISSGNGTKNFTVNKDRKIRDSLFETFHPGLADRIIHLIDKLESQESPDAEVYQELYPDLSTYDFIFREFEYRQTFYNVAVVPEVYGDIEGLDFTGSYLITIISTSEGTKQVKLEYDEHMRWVPGENDRGMDPGLIDEFDKMIKASRN